MSPDLESLQLRQGEPVTAKHIAAISAAANRTDTSGLNVRERQLPWGKIRHYDGGSGGGTSAIFAPSAVRVAEGFAVSFERGLIAGIEPSLAGIGISEIDPTTNKRPALIVPVELLENPRAEVGIYFRVTFSKEWQAEKAEPFASIDAPKRAPWTFDKLACTLAKTGALWRSLYWNLGIESINRGGDGYAKHVPYAQ